MADLTDLQRGELCGAADAIEGRYPHLAKLLRAEASGAVPEPNDVAWGCSYEIATKYMRAVAKRVGLPEDAKWPDIMANLERPAVERFAVQYDGDCEPNLDSLWETRSGAVDMLGAAKGRIVKVTITPAGEDGG